MQVEKSLRGRPSGSLRQKTLFMGAVRLAGGKVAGTLRVCEGRVRAGREEVVATDTRRKWRREILARSMFAGSRDGSHTLTRLGLRARIRHSDIYLRNSLSRVSNISCMRISHVPASGTRPSACQRLADWNLR